MSEYKKIPFEIRGAIDALNGDMEKSLLIVLYNNQNKKLTIFDLVEESSFSDTEEIKDCMENLVDGGLARKQGNFKNPDDIETKYFLSEYGGRFLESTFISLHEFDIDYDNEELNIEFN